MSRKYIIGVELLTGLAIGAAAAAATVALITAFLVSRDLRAESAHMATVTAYSVNSSIDPGDLEGSFYEDVLPLVNSGSIQAVALFDSTGAVLGGLGIDDGSIDSLRETGDWFFAQDPSSGLTTAVRPAVSSGSAIYDILIIGLAALTTALAVLAFFTPRYLSRTVILPLRDILVEADRFKSGGGADPEAAGASFHRLVELLHERERQLNELREKAEERAERVEKRSAAILSVLGSAVFSMDAAGCLSLYNRQSGELFRLDFEDIGKAFPWNRTEAGSLLRPQIEALGDSDHRSAEFQVRSDSGRAGKIYNVEISRSRSDEIAVLVTDVTRIGELERRIADQTAMADIGAASAGISHEMGNTLCALSGFVDLLARGHSDERTGKILSEVRKEVESAQALITSFGSFARSPEPETMILGREEIEGLCIDVCKLDPERCSTSMDCSDFSIRADRKLLSSCIRNIVRNALEADGSSEVMIRVTKEPEGIAITITDSGPGFSMDREEIFRPFRTTKDRNRGNMGLGLPVSRRIIRAMGGELQGNSGEDGGAVFTIVLPESV